MSDKTGGAAGAGEGAGAASAAAAAGAGKTAETIAGAGATAAAAAADTGSAAAGSAAAAAAGEAAGAAAATGAGAGEAAPDWRTRMAGGDAKELARLQRFTDEAAYHKSYRALEAKLSSGELKRALPENASAEEVAAWRKDNGIPDKPEGYLEKLTLPDGLVLGEADKPVAESFAKRALEKNWSPQQFNDAVGWYYENLEAQQTAQAEADAAFKQTSDDALRTEWQGADYRANLNAIQNLFAGWPQGLAQQLLAARSPEGQILGNDPAFVKQMAALARELNPAASLIPAGGADPAKGVAERIKEIKSWMGAKKGTPESKKYWGDEKVQAEYRSLIEAQERMKARAA